MASSARGDGPNGFSFRLSAIGFEPPADCFRGLDWLVSASLRMCAGTNSGKSVMFQRSAEKLLTAEIAKFAEFATIGHGRFRCGLCEIFAHFEVKRLCSFCSPHLPLISIFEFPEYSAAGILQEEHPGSTVHSARA